MYSVDIFLAASCRLRVALFVAFWNISRYLWDACSRTDSITSVGLLTMAPTDLRKGCFLFNMLFRGLIIGLLSLVFFNMALLSPLCSLVIAVLLEKADGETSRWFYMKEVLVMICGR